MEIRKLHTACNFAALTYAVPNYTLPQGNLLINFWYATPKNYRPLLFQLQTQMIGSTVIQNSSLKSTSRTEDWRI